MKKLNARVILLSCAFFSTAFTFAQTKNPVSQQRKADLAPGQKLPVIKQVFNPTLKTVPNASLAPVISDGVDVRVFPSANVQAEATIAINKSNPLNLLASANTYVTTYNQGFYSSSDGGVTWTGADKLSGINQNLVYGDPTVSFSYDGTAFMTSINANGGYWFQKSTNGGVNWTAGVSGDNGTGYDKGMSTSDDISTSPYVNSFYHAWTDFNSGNGAVVFNKSTDKGVTFSAKKTLRSGSVGFGQGTCVATGLNGEIYVCYADHTSVISPYPATGMGFVRSLDGGTTFTPHSVIFPYSGTRVDYTSNIYNGTRVNDFPSLAVDKSNNHPGRIYITYPEKNSGDSHSEIKVRYSDNQGTSWSPAIVVNITNARQSFFPWITVDAVTGFVWVAYYALDQPTGYSANTYVAVSNGKKWINQKVSDVPHTVAAINNSLFAFGYAGDYIGVAAHNGKGYPTWMDNRNGTWQVYCSPVTITAAAFSGSVQEAVVKTPKINKLTVSPNPVSTTAYLTLTNTGMRSVELYNQAGVLVKKWNSVSAGNLNVAGVPKGTYIIKVIGTDNKTYSQTLIKE